MRGRFSKQVATLEAEEAADVAIRFFLFVDRSALYTNINAINSPLRLTRSLREYYNISCGF